MIRLACALGAAMLAAPAHGLGPLAGPAGMTEIHSDMQATARFALPVRKAGSREGVTEPVDGAVLVQTFRGAMPDTPLAAVRAASAALEADGFEIDLDCAAEACGGFDFRTEIHVVPQPAMVVNIADFHQRTLRRPDRSMAVSLLASRLGGRTHLQAVTVATAPTEAAPDATARSVADPADPVEILWRQLSTAGRVVLEGVSFETATAETRPSAGSLATVAALMAARPDLRLAVVGHSDGVGALAPNLRLSLARAEAVAAALVALGVPAARLEASGAAWLAPLASNATEAGRARNRRVEVVLR